MTSASSSLVRIKVRQSGMIELTKRVRLSRTCGGAIVIGPSAVAICFGRWPFREPRAVGVRSKRAHQRNRSTSSSIARWNTSWAPRRPSLLKPAEVVDVALAFESIEQQSPDLGFDLDARGYPCLHSVVLLCELPRVRFGAYAVFTVTAVSGRHLPVVQIDCSVDGVVADAVVVDNFSGTQEAVTHLIGSGHRRIAILTGPLQLTTGRQRLMGYQAALESHAIPLVQELIHIGSFLRENAIRDSAALFDIKPRPNAVFAGNTFLAAAAAWFSLTERGLKVPDDISLVAFDDTSWMRMVVPAVTTVRQPVTEIARRATELLLERLSGSESGPVQTFGLQAHARGQRVGGEVS